MVLTPLITPSSGALDVVSTLAVTSPPECSRARSVNVPPISMARLGCALMLASTIPLEGSQTSAHSFLSGTRNFYSRLLLGKRQVIVTIVFDAESGPIKAGGKMGRLAGKIALISGASRGQ